MKVMPSLGRLMAQHLRNSDEEETTMMQVSVLFHIQERPITASELAKKRRVSLQSASVLVQGLVEKGWLVRTPDPKDRRQFLLEITPEGRERAETTRRQIAELIAGVMSHLTEEEVAAASVFIPALQRVLTQQFTIDDSKQEKIEPVPEA